MKKRAVKAETALAASERANDEKDKFINLLLKTRSEPSTLLHAEQSDQGGQVGVATAGPSRNK